ncbi:unnamed protein product [Blepharisma stoltei]|uniref:Uncharacterized protein n=1 Tax=Blepharisma stoltei TaxID=1481888 RepID=A0AAU9J8C1_9CILI|nr:unnamed protein product [Blepharisma stoltei]
MRSKRNSSMHDLEVDLMPAHLTARDSPHISSIAHKETLLFDSIRRSSLNPSAEKTIKHARHNSMKILQSPSGSNWGSVDNKTYKPTHVRSGSDLSYLIIPTRSSVPSSPTSYKLGPGYYNVSLSTLAGPSFQFSTLSRFSNKDAYLYLPAINKQPPNEATRKEKFKEIIRDNKNMYKYIPENRIKTIQERAVAESTRIVEAIHKKQDILLTKKLEKILNFESKQRRFEFKLKRDEVTKIYKSWIALNVVFGWAADANVKYLHRKDLHERSQGVLKQLMILCLAVGKFKRLHKRVKVIQAIRTFRRMKAPAVKWVKNIKNHHRSRICELAERALSKDVMFNLMAAFIRTVIFIQRTMRCIVKQRQQGLMIKHLLWNKVEYRMYVEHCVKKHTLPKSELDKRISFQAIQGRSSIPVPVKEFVIKQNLKLRRDAYMESLKNYKKTCQQLKENYEKTRYKREADAALYSRKVEELQLPSKPQPSYVFSEQDFRKMINETEQKRGEWDEIIKKTQNK